jgi:hypothetical protein
MKVFVSKLKSLKLKTWHYLTLIPRNTWIGVILIACGIATITDSVKDSQWYRANEVLTTNEKVQNSVNSVVNDVEIKWKTATNNRLETEKYFYEVLRAELDDFYKWLHKRKIDFRTKIYDVISMLPGKTENIVKQEETLQKIARRIDTYQALDFSRLSFEREMEVQRRLRSISVLSYSLFQYIKTMNKRIKPVPATLDLSFEPIRKKLLSQRITFDTSSEEITIDWKPVWIGLILMALGIYTIRRDRYDTEYIRHLEAVQKSEGPDFINTKPVNHYLLDLYRKHYNEFEYVACVMDSNYNIQWMNAFGKNAGVDSNDLEMALQNSFRDKNDRPTIVLRQEVYHVFHSNIPIETYYADVDLSKEYSFVQLVPATIDVYEFSTLVTPEEFGNMQRKFNDKHTAFMINDTFADLLAKMNFVFQVNGTIVDFAPLDDDMPCAFNIEEFDQFMVDYMKQLGRVIQQQPSIGRVFFTLTENNGRIYFSTFVPDMHFSENWSSEKDLIAEKEFVEQLSYTQTKMTSHLLRVSIRNRQIADESGAEIVVAFENPVHDENTAARA